MSLLALHLSAIRCQLGKAARARRAGAPRDAGGGERSQLYSVVALRLVVLGFTARQFRNLLL